MKTGGGIVPFDRIRLSIREGGDLGGHVYSASRFTREDIMDWLDYAADL